MMTNVNPMDIHYLLAFPDSTITPQEKSSARQIGAIPTVPNMASYIAQPIIYRPLIPSHQAEETLYQEKAISLYSQSQQPQIKTTADAEPMTLEQIRGESNSSQKKVILNGIKKSGKWSKKEDKKLADLISKHGGNAKKFTRKIWKQIAEQMKTRTIQQIKYHWFRQRDPSLKLNRAKWTPEENKIIMEQVKELGKQWVKIANSLEGRTGHQIQRHYEYVLRTGVRRSPWTEREDGFLKEGVEKFGKKWVKVAAFINENMGTDTVRIGSQCWRRWNR